MTDCVKDLNVTLIERTTVADALVRCFAEDWDMQRKVHDARDDELVTVSISYHASVPAVVAKAALQAYRASKGSDVIPC
jgi:hypothetical protein